MKKYYVLFSLGLVLLSSVVLLVSSGSIDANATSYVYLQESINPSRSYSYRVRAVNRAGISSFATCNYSVPQTAPDAPTDLYGQSPTLEYNVNVYWVNHPANALYNYIERRISGQATWQAIATVAYNVDSYSDDTAQAGQTYQYRVRAMNPVGSSYSNVISVEVIEWRSKSCVMNLVTQGRYI